MKNMVLLLFSFLLWTHCSVGPNILEGEIGKEYLLKTFIVDSSGRKPVFLDESSYKNWSDCFMEHADALDFVLKCGNYVSWGRIEPPIRDDTEIVRIISSSIYHNNNYHHPYTLYGSDKAVYVEGFELKSVSNYVIKGLVIEGASKTIDGFTGGRTNFIRDNSNSNLVSDCYIRNVCRGAGLRILNSNSNLVYKCVFEQTNVGLTGDNVAILISAHTGKESNNNRIVANEIFNWNDGIGLLRHTSTEDPRFNQTGNLNATYIADNDIYIDSSLYVYRKEGVYACAENGMDIKQGTNSIKSEDRIKILNNRLWGFRMSYRDCYSSGSAGSAIVLHRSASNIDIFGNYIFDCPIGIMISGINPRYQDEFVENIRINNNVFSSIRDYSDFPYDGVGIYQFRGAEILGNYFVDLISPALYRNPTNVNYFMKNEMISVQSEYLATSDLEVIERNRVRSYSRGTKISIALKGITTSDTISFDF